MSEKNHHGLMWKAGQDDSNPKISKSDLSAPYALGVEVKAAEGWESIPKVRASNQRKKEPESKCAWAFLDSCSCKEGSWSQHVLESSREVEAVMDSKPSTSKTGKLIAAKFSKLEIGPKIGTPSLGKFRRGHLFFQLLLWDSF